MLRAWLVASVLLTFMGGHTLAQSLIQSSRVQSSGVRSSGESSTLHNEPSRRHLGPNGKPCLALEGYTKPQAINKNVFEHWIRATNTCGQHIELRVCYHKSNDCIAMNVPPWDTKSSVLGIYPMKDFQYDAKEKF
jgi:hypothetical protein